MCQSEISQLCRRILMKKHLLQSSQQHPDSSKIPKSASIVGLFSIFKLNFSFTTGLISSSTVSIKLFILVAEACLDFVKKSCIILLVVHKFQKVLSLMIHLSIETHFPRNCNLDSFNQYSNQNLLTCCGKLDRNFVIFCPCSRFVIVRS